MLHNTDEIEIHLLPSLEGNDENSNMEVLTGIARQLIKYGSPEFDVNDMLTVPRSIPPLIGILYQHDVNRTPWENLDALNLETMLAIAGTSCGKRLWPVTIGTPVHTLSDICNLWNNLISPKFLRPFRSNPSFKRLRLHDLHVGVTRILANRKEIKLAFLREYNKTGERVRETHAGKIIHKKGQGKATSSFRFYLPSLSLAIVT